MPGVEWEKIVLADCVLKFWRLCIPKRNLGFYCADISAQEMVFWQKKLTDLFIIVTNKFSETCLLKHCLLAWMFYIAALILNIYTQTKMGQGGICYNTDSLTCFFFFSFAVILGTFFCSFKNKMFPFIMHLKCILHIWVILAGYPLA